MRREPLARALYPFARVENELGAALRALLGARSLEAVLPYERSADWCGPEAAAAAFSALLHFSSHEHRVERPGRCRKRAVQNPV